MVMDKRKHLILVSHTHWDREWYLTFNQFRLRLLNVIDAAIDLAANPAWHSFMLDGQAAPLEDYLEVRPGREAALTAAIASGKLTVGPWYVLADEFLESAEGLVRNLLIGHRVAGKFGPVMRCGYVPDTFGHVWQLPQVLAGFNIKTCYLFRGYPPLFGNHEECKGLNDDTPLEFLWAAPDGTKALTLHHITGYGNAASISDGATAGDFKHMGALTRILMSVDRLAPRSKSSTLLLMNGTDHLLPDPNVPEVVEFFNADPELKDDFSLVQGSLVEYFDAIERDAATLPVLSGEMRGSAYTQVTPACLSSRMYLKQRNWDVSTDLERWAEGASLVAWYLGHDYPHDQLTLAWKLLLKNHPHDSICGCSIDRVHDDMETRFDEISDITGTIIDGALHVLARAVPVILSDGCIPLVVFNATAWNQSGPVSILVPVPVDANPMDHVLENANGVTETRVEKTIIADYRTLPDADRLYPALHARYKVLRVSFMARDVPGLGFKTWRLLHKPGSTVAGPAVPAGFALDNEHLSVSVHGDGTLSVVHKTTGKTWRDLAILEDAGDDGDEYDYAPPHDGQPLHSKGVPARLSRADTLACQAVHVATRMQLPASITPYRRRSSELVEQAIDMTVALHPGEPFVRITIELDNSVEDHRLRALFPTGLAVASASASDHFMVMERPVALPRDDGWYQPAQGLYHTDGFVDVSDGTHGLSVFTKGLPEYEMLPGMDNAIAITLFRSVGFLSRDGNPVARGHLGRPSGLNGPFLPTPGAQCKRRMRFELAVYPHAGTWDEALVCKHAMAFQVPFKCVAKTSQPYFYEPRPVVSPTKLFPSDAEGFITVAPESLVVSAVKRAEEGNGVVVRVYNPTRRSLHATMSFSFEISMASVVNLNEDFVESIMHEKTSFEMDVDPCRIVTVMVTPRRFTRPGS